MGCKLPAGPSVRRTWALALGATTVTEGARNWQGPLGQRQVRGAPREAAATPALEADGAAGRDCAREHGLGEGRGRPHARAAAVSWDPRGQSGGAQGGPWGAPHPFLRERFPRLRKRRCRPSPERPRVAECMHFKVSGCCLQGCAWMTSTVWVFVGKRGCVLGPGPGDDSTWSKNVPVAVDRQNTGAPLSTEGLQWARQRAARGTGPVLRVGMRPPRRGPLAPGQAAGRLQS